MTAIIIWIVSSVIVAGAISFMMYGRLLNARIAEAELEFARAYSEHDVYVEDYLRHLENIDRLLRRCDICKAK